MILLKSLTCEIRLALGSSQFRFLSKTINREASSSKPFLEDGNSFILLFDVSIDDEPDGPEKELKSLKPTRIKKKFLLSKFFLKYSNKVYFTFLVCI